MLHCAAPFFSQDVWSCGLTLLAVLLGHQPLRVSKGGGYWELLTAICDDAVPIPEDRLSESLVALLSSCLEKQPSQRPTTSTLLGHDFFMGHSSVLWSSLVERPHTEAKKKASPKGSRHEDKALHVKARPMHRCPEELHV